MSTDKKILSLIPENLHEELFKEVQQAIEEKKQAEKTRPRTAEEEKEHQAMIKRITSKM